MALAKTEVYIPLRVCLPGMQGPLGINVYIEGRRLFITGDDLVILATQTNILERVNVERLVCGIKRERKKEERKCGEEKDEKGENDFEKGRRARDESSSGE